MLDALRWAGTRLVDALDAAEDDARGLFDKYSAEADVRGRRAEQASRDRQDAAARRAAAETDERRFGERVAERKAARATLTERGLLEPQESASTARSRWSDVAKRAAALRIETEDQRREAEGRRNDTQRERADLVRELGTRESEARAEAERLADAQREREALETHPTVADLEENERADVFAHGLEDRLRSSAATLDAARLHSAVEGAEDERARRSVRVQGLLPSPIDVDRVARALRAEGFDAYAAPAYLAENLGSDVERKRGLVAADPSRFFGVMVPEAQRATAQRAASALTAELRAPVVLSACALDAPGAAADAYTLVPSEAGAFDHQAAAVAAGKIDRRTQERATRDDDRARKATELRRLADSVARFVAAWRNGELDRLAERVDGLLAEVERLQRRHEQIDRALADLHTAIERLEAKKERAGTEAVQAERARERIDDFVEHMDRHVEGWNRALREARATISAADEAIRAADDEREHANARRDEAVERRSQSKARADALSDERARVQHVTDDEVPSGPLGAARRAYAEQLAAYERAIGDSEIRGHLAASEDELNRETTKLTRLLDGFEREAVAAMSARVGERLDALTKEAREVRIEAEATVRNTERALDDARRELRGVPDRVRQSDDLPSGELPPTTASECRRVAEERSAEARVAREALATTNAELEANKGLLVELRATVTGHGHDLKRLEDAEIVPRGTSPLPEATEDVTGLVDRAVERLRRGRLAAREAEATAGERAEAVRQVALDSRFADHESAWKQRLLEPPAALAADARRWAEGLGERVAALDDEIASVEQDREYVVNQLLGVAEEGLRLLNRAERSSRLPESLGRWAGQPFLKIALEVPAAPDERRARLAPLVDERGESGQVPAGLELVQRSIDRLHGSRPMRVTILKPETSRRLDRVDVASMANFSGGERLTAAVLLYCTLVRLRANARGRRGEATGNVLVLDNPIGTCSSVPLIELQREVAAAMGTQLIYTTGVEDLAALAQLPNVVRLRNVHRDRATGDLHVTLEEEGIVEGVRVGRRASADGAR